MTRRTFTLVALLVTTASGCWFTPPWSYDPALEEAYGFQEPEPLPVVEQGELAGDFSTFHRPSPADADVTSYGHTVEVFTTAHGGAMAQLEVMGDLSTIPAGTSVTWNMHDDAVRGELFVIVVGCAGGGPQEWEVDAIAEEVSVDVSETIDRDGRVLRQYGFEARFPADPNGGRAGDVTVLSGRFAAYGAVQRGSVQRDSHR